MYWTVWMANRVAGELRPLEKHLGRMAGLVLAAATARRARLRRLARYLESRRTRTEVCSVH